MTDEQARRIEALEQENALLFEQLQIARQRVAQLESLMTKRYRLDRGMVLAEIPEPGVVLNAYGTVESGDFED